MRQRKEEHPDRLGRNLHEGETMESSNSDKEQSARLTTTTRKNLGSASAEHITILDELDIAARLDSFRLLTTGWCEGRGEAPSTEGLDWLSQAFEQYYPDDIPLPHLYPTPEGGVQAEWSLDTTEASLEIDINTHKGWWHVLNIETDSDTRDIDLDDEAGWQELAEALRRLSGGAH